MLWILGALLTTFYILNEFHEKESDIRQDFNLSFDQAQSVIKHSASIMRDIRYIAENRLSWSVTGLDMINGVFSGKNTLPPLTPIFQSQIANY